MNFELRLNFWIMSELLNYGWTFELQVNFELLGNFRITAILLTSRILLFMDWIGLGADAVKMDRKLLFLTPNKMIVQPKNKFLSFYQDEQ